MEKYAEFIMQNAGLDGAQAGVKIAGRNIGDLRYVAMTTLVAQMVKCQPTLQDTQVQSLGCLLSQGRDECGINGLTVRNVRT